MGRFLRKIREVFSAPEEIKRLKEDFSKLQREKAEEKTSFEAQIKELEEKTKKLESDIFEERKNRESAISSSELLGEYLHGEGADEYD